ncbi:MAG: Transcriptional regulator [Clostridia bacterium]|jgi:GntR family transcriptional repressor for pyruvate dehydrogenase complex|nr:Transcriptional regulator [Clostridia bacterium]
MKRDFIAVKPVSRDMLYTKIADAILEYIKRNKLKNGDKIPSERVLAEQFSTSRNSVREALRVLENEKIIEVKTGKGAYVTSTTSSDSIYLKLWKVNYEELLETKYLLERCVVEKLCGKLTADELSYLEEPLIQLETSARMGIFLKKADFVFHSHLRHLMKNSALEQMIDNLILALDNYGEVLQGAESIWLTTIPYHRQMFNAIKHCNYMEAEDACKQIYEIDQRALRMIDFIRKEL